MRRVTVVLLVAVLACAAAAEGQQGVSGVRMIRAWTEPASPGFGEPAVVKVELRIAPGVMVFLPDTLNAAAEMASIGTGEWEAKGEAGDTLSVLATYPIIGFRKGIQELPELEIAAGTVPAGTRGSRVSRMADARAGAGGTLLTAAIPLGSTTIGEYTAVEEPGENAAVVPRPPADVIGGDWSIWLMLAIGLASATGVGALGSLLPRWWSGKGSGLMARLRGRSAKQQALKELDRLRSLGWHKDGRVDDFYAAASGALRQFAAHVHPEYSSALTTTELIALLESKGNPARVQRLSGALATAELVKFGTLRPDAVTAEGDWSVIREWVVSTPEP